MAIKANTAEGLAGATNGLAVTTSSQTAAGGDQCTLSGTAARWTLVTGGFHGTYAYRVAHNSTENPLMLYNLTTNQVSTSLYFKLASMPSVISAFVAVSNATVYCAAAFITPAGGIDLHNNVGASIGVLAAGIVPGVWYRLDFCVAVGTTITNGTIRGGVFLGDQTTPIVASINNLATNTGTTALTNWQWGAPGASTSTSFNIDFDDIRHDDTWSTFAGAHGYTAASTGVRFVAVAANPGGLTASSDFIADLADSNSTTGVTSPGVSTNESITYTLPPITAGSLTGSLKALWVGGANSMRARLFQGATQVSVDGNHPLYVLTNAEATYTWTNTAGENSAITDWNDLRMQILFNAT